MLAVSLSTNLSLRFLETKNAINKQIEFSAASNFRAFHRRIGFWELRRSADKTLEKQSDETIETDQTSD